MFWIILIAVLFFAYTNGANDTVKGVATIIGSGTAGYQNAITWATITTLLGSVASVFIAASLLKSFSGYGLVPVSLLSSSEFTFAVSFGAAFTVFIATKIGMPVSSTHALVGAIAGTGVMAVGSAFNFIKLINTFFLPLIISPLIAVLFCVTLYYIFTSFRNYSGITKDSCAYIVHEQKVYALMNQTAIAENSLFLKKGTISQCASQYNGTIVGISAQKTLDAAHYISSGAVSFARGLNDTPKIAGLLLLGNFSVNPLNTVMIILVMIAGGLLGTKKVGDTMSKNISPMNHGQGVTANLVTALLVSTASFNGLPVSTTHVSVGSLFGIGMVTKKINRKVISEILFSWILTLPVAGLLSAGIYLLVKTIL